MKMKKNKKIKQPYIIHWLATEYLLQFFLSKSTILLWHNTALDFAGGLN